MKTVWILTRFDDNPTGERTPSAAGEGLAEVFRERVVRPVLLDPLDAAFYPRDGRLAFRHEAEPLPEADAVITFLDPLRPDHDLLFLESLPVGGAEVRNTPKSLSLFRDPALPNTALSGAGVPAVPVARLRRPHAVDGVIEKFGLPVEARIPVTPGRWGLVRFEDKGSLRAMMDLLWREDAFALVSPAPEKADSDSWVSVVGGEVMGGEAPQAAEAAQVLGLDLCAVRLREESDEPWVAEVIPYPAPPKTSPSPETLQAVADLVS